MRRATEAKKLDRSPSLASQTNLVQEMDKYTSDVTGEDRGTQGVCLQRLHDCCCHNSVVPPLACTNLAPSRIPWQKVLKFFWITLSQPVKMERDRQRKTFTWSRDDPPGQRCPELDNTTVTRPYTFTVFKPDTLKRGCQIRKRGMSDNNVMIDD